MYDQFIHVGAWQVQKIRGHSSKGIHYQLIDKGCMVKEEYANHIGLV